MGAQSYLAPIPFSLWFPVQGGYFRGWGVASPPSPYTKEEKQVLPGPIRADTGLGSPSPRIPYHLQSIQLVITS